MTEMTNEELAVCIIGVEVAIRTGNRPTDSDFKGTYILDSLGEKG